MTHASSSPASRWTFELATALFLVALGLPAAAHAQRDIVVFVDAEAQLDDVFAIELASRGLSARFALPSTGDYPARTSAAGAVGAIWLESGADGAVTVFAFRADLGTRSSVRLPTTQGSVDARQLAIVSAALLEDLLADSGATPAPQVEVITELDPAASDYHVPALGIYSGISSGAWLRFAPSFEANFSASYSMGLQWIEGFRLGIVVSLDAYVAQGATFSATGGQYGGGVELGARLGDDVVAVHFGVQGLVALGRPHAETRGANTDFMVIAGGYLGVGFWAGRRADIGLRIEGDVWHEPGFATSPVARLVLRCEWR